MIGQLEASIVRILNAAGGVAGAGFRVSDRHVLTCAHVVARAVGLTDSSNGMPGADVTLDFPLAARGTTLAARTILWRPTASPASPQPDGADDLAVLELATDPPPSSRHCRLVTAADLWGHGFRAFGFPSRRDDGVWATGVLRGRQAAGWIHIEDVKEAGYRVQPGFSGAPVWDETLDGVAGMVVAADGQPDVRAAFMIPTEVLVTAWPPLGSRAIPPCPYRGLFAFREEDASVFYGRDTVSATLAEAVAERSLVAVLGASGSGKSSMVFAGLVPLLRGQGTWAIASFRPGAHPFHALASGLITVLEAQMSETDRLLEVSKLAQALRQGDLALTDVVQRVLDKTDAARLLLVADQFEELYTLAEAPEDRTPFLDLLLASSHGDELCTVVTLRADFLGHALSYRPVADALQGADHMLGPMNRQELREVVEGPTHALGVQIEEGLTTRILDAVGNEPGNLPLLEFALTLLWNRQERGLLTHAAYEATGGVEGALAGHAEEVYGRLSDQDKQRAQRVLVQLEHPGDGVQDTRRVAVREEVGDDGWELVIRLAGSRLVVTGRQEQTGAQTVEIVHEALITGWDRLRGWMQTDRAFRLWQERLRSALRQWEAAGHDDGALLRGAPLAEATGWRTSRGPDLSHAEAGFIQASACAAEEAEREKEAARQRELTQAQALAEEQSRRAEQQAKYAKLRGRQVIALGLAFTLAIGLASFAWYERGQSERRRLVSIQRDLAAQVPIRLARKQDDVAALLALQAYKLGQQVSEPGTTNADEPLRESLTTTPFGRELRSDGTGGAASVAFSPDGRTLASVGSEAPELWDLGHVDAAPRVLKGHNAEPLSSVAYSADGRTLASGGVGTFVLLWDLTHPLSPPTVLNSGDPDGEGFISVAFSPDGTTLASADWFGAVRLWDLRRVDDTPRVLKAQPPEGASSSVSSVVFSPDGRTLASGANDATVRLWNMDRPDAAPRVLKGHEKGVTSVAFSPEGRTLASGANDATVRLWNMDRPDAGPAILAGHKGYVRSVAFSPDGTTLALGDGVVRLWDLGPADAAPMTLDDHEAANVSSVAFSPDGTTLAVGGQDVHDDGVDGIVQLWDLRHANMAPRVLKGHGQFVSSIGFSPDSRILASGGGDVVRLWDLSRQDDAPRELRGNETQVFSVAFSPDGTTLASAGWNGISSEVTLRLWDLDHLDVIPRVLKGQGSATIDSVAFSPDGKTLASGGDDVRLWDLRRPDAPPKVLKGHEAPVDSVAFGSDGKTLASGSADHTVRLWDLRRPDAPPKVLKGHEAPVRSVAFSPDGKTLASGSDDVRLWDLRQPDAPSAVLKDHESPNSLAFSPDAKTLALESAGKVVVVPTTWALTEMVCKKSLRNLTSDEWTRFVGVDIPYERTCPNLPSGRGVRG